MNTAKPLIIIGAGGHGRVVADIANLLGYSSISFLDDKDIQSSGAYPVLGKTQDACEYIKSSVFFVAIGDTAYRRALQERLEDMGAEIVSLVHPNAVLANGVKTGKGVAIMAGAVVNSGAVIKDGAILNTCCSVDHDCVVGCYSHISVGAHLAGTVRIGDEVLVGAGATVINNITVCDGCTVGAGAVLINDAHIKGVYIGVPAKQLKKM